MAKKEVKEKYYANKFNNVFGPMMGTPIGRIQFVALVNPQMKFQPPKFGATFLFDKKDPAAKAALNKMIAECSELKAFAESKGIDTEGFTVPPIQDGDDAKVSKYQGYAGSYYISAKNPQRIEVVDSQSKPIDAAMIMPGVLVRGVVTPIIYADGFSWRLHVVQLVKDDGVRFHAGADPKSLLSALDVEETEAVVEEEIVVTPPETVVAAKSAPKKSGKQLAIGML